MPFRKVLVANRGEIAVRVLRALRESGIAGVAVYSDADRHALHTRYADEAVHIGPAASSESYLNIERVIDAAKRNGAEAIHPGYGFLSENPDFAEACERAGLVFIGPSFESIRALGSKTRARSIAASVGAPTVPGTPPGVRSHADLRSVALKMGLPVMIKAAAGGGGKGMRRVDVESELDSALRDASSESERSFGSGEVYVEKLIDRPRHIEIQILGDKFGHSIHLGERECSLQRRYQKVVEECPSVPGIDDPGLRDRMGEAALQIARAAGYWSAGTLEFLVDSSGEFYFLEMNTRLQVEHPVTEMVTGVDLVQWQLRIAAGERLTLRQEDVAWRGSAIQCRLYAEDPENGFFPSPGRIDGLRLPSGPGIRVDSGVYDGWTVPIDYDPLLAKLIAWAPTRSEAVRRIAAAVDETFAGGIRTNVRFFRDLFRDPEFAEGRLHTSFIPEFQARRSRRGAPKDVAMAAAVVAAMQASRPRREQKAERSSRWLRDGLSGLMR